MKNSISKVQPEDFKLYTLINSKNTDLKILNYAAAIFSLKIEDRRGEQVNVIASPEDPMDYLHDDYKKYNKGFGASIGRYAGRINGGEFTIGEHRKNFQQKEIGHVTFDDTFVLEGKQPGVSLYSSKTGIRMDINTNQPAVVLYAPQDLPDEKEYQTEISSKEEM